MTKYIARFGAMRTLGIFSAADNMSLRHGSRVVLRTRRGQEVGTILREATDELIEQFSDTPEDRVIRVMTRADESELRRIKAGEPELFRVCKEVMARMKMAMVLVRIEHLFGGERVVVYYVAEGRIDFRELVKALASEFQTRIEMRQIGVRDETRLLADCGDCGREVCCNSHMMEMQPVSMKMAKLQKATLDPTKISGRCGRLKCCLRYEYDLYCELQQGLPSVGKRITTPDGPGRVVSCEILQRRVTVNLDDHSYKVYTGDELGTRNTPPPTQD
ncbi:MAG: PSP1 domain-containing protein [Thermoguttaceae bacterium]